MVMLRKRARYVRRHGRPNSGTAGADTGVGLSVPRRVSRADEPIEFRPVAGLESEFAGWAMVERSRTWGIGTYGIGGYLVLILVVIGSALC